MKNLAVKQVHLDFHTSEHCPNVGSMYDKKNFQQALKLGKLDSITIFAKCHHSWCYFPTKVGTMHPTMDKNFDMLGQMIHDAHEIGVKAPVYITVGWSHNDSLKHPEWTVKTKDGKTMGGLDLPDSADLPGYSWNMMCINSEYKNHIYALTEEICDRYGNELDGLFYDICCIFYGACYCDKCVKDMKNNGIDVNDEAQAKEFTKNAWIEFQNKCREILFKRQKDATIFLNGSASPSTPYFYKLNTHIEMEDLPTTWGGYDKMPSKAKYFAKTGMEYLGMTGKFHEAWGEFGGFKNPKALTYEVASMLTYGAKCSIGDQMHPLGFMDLETYRLIGEAYDYVDKIKNYCYNLDETTNLACVSSTIGEANEGLVKILLENQLDFDVVTNLETINNYDCIIIPEGFYLDEQTKKQLDAYISSGKGVLFCGDSCLNQEKTNFLIDAGIEYIGQSEFEMDYVKFGNKLSQNLVKSPIKCYVGATKTKITKAVSLAEVYEPYFRRTVGEFCGHLNAPYKSTPATYPAAIIYGNIVYLAHNIPSQYYYHALKIAKDYFINALKLVYKNPVLKVSLPSAGRVRLAKDDKKYVLHLSYAQPAKRGCVEVIEDMPTLYNIPIEFITDRKITRAYTVPQMKEQPFMQDEEKVKLTVAELTCHQVIVFDI
jgi:hypothetical protein